MNRIEKEIAKSVNPEAAKELLDRFHELSTKQYAGWAIDLEYFLWESTLQVDDNPSTFSWRSLKRYQGQEMILLSKLCQGWWVWKDPEGETFVSLAKMEQLYERWKNSRPEVTPILEDDTENPNGIMYKLRQIKI